MTEMERTLEEIGIKVRDEHSQIRSKDDIIKDIMEMMKGRPKEDYDRLMLMLLIAKEIDRPFP